MNLLIFVEFFLFIILNFKFLIEDGWEFSNVGKSIFISLRNESLVSSFLLCFLK